LMLHMFSHICCNDMFQMLSAVSVLCYSKWFSCCKCFIWMLHMFHTHVASVCHKYFICFKCMLHSSVSYCQCRLPALVSMRAGRAKPWPPMRGGGACRRRLCARRHRLRGAVMEEVGASHPSSMGSGSEVGGLDVSTRNRAGVDGAQI